jgi:hypothetical protein
MLMMSDTSFGLILAYSLMRIGSIYMSNLTNKDVRISGEQCQAK